MLAEWKTWFEDRFGLEPIKRHFLYRRVPKTSWYQGDGSALLLLLGVLVVTGMFMAATYSPAPDSAYDSVRHLTEQQFLGWYIRGLHYWCGGLMMVMVLFHLLRLILVAGYKFPHEGTWLVGVILLVLVVINGYIGYVLRWDERAIYALRISLNMFWNVPWIGEHLVVFVQGGSQLGMQTFTRLYAVHVVFVPLLLLGLAGYHLYLVVLHGVTSKAERRRPIRTPQQQELIYDAAKKSERYGEQFHPTTTAQTGTMAFVVFLIALVLTLTVGPGDLQPEANLVEPSMPRGEWYFWWYSALIALLPSRVAPAFMVVFPLAVLAALVLLPFLDRGEYRGWRMRPAAVALVIGIVVGMLYLTDLRRRSPWTGWPQNEPPPVPRGIELASGAEQGRHLFAVYGCNSCHAVSGAGPQVGPDLAWIEHRMSAQELQAYILEPPAGIPMPGFRDRMPRQDLDRVVEFVLAAQTFPYEQNRGQ